MNAFQIGLPPEQRQLVAGMLRQALDDIGGKDDRPSSEHAGDVTIALLAKVDAFGADAGLFELAAGCAHIIGGENSAAVDGVSMRYDGFTSGEGGGRPATGMQRDVSAFVTAVMNADRRRAWAIWLRYAPGDDEVPQATADFLALLIRNAWSRHAGGALKVTIEATGPWPPVCDFCCFDRASWMWFCRPEPVTFTLRGTNNETTVDLQDMEFWYGCATCKHLVSRPRPDWNQVFARQRRHRRDADKQSVVTMFNAYQRARRSAKPVPLPAQRPVPTASRGEAPGTETG